MNDQQSRPTVRVDFEELRFAMEDASYEHQYFLDTETGEVILISEYDDDEESTQRLEAIDEAEPAAIRRFHVPNRATAIRTCESSSIQSATNSSNNCSR